MFMEFLLSRHQKPMKCRFVDALSHVFGHCYRLILWSYMLNSSFNMLDC